MSVAIDDLSDTKYFQLLHFRGVLVATKTSFWFTIGSIKLNASNNTDIFLEKCENVRTRQDRCAERNGMGFGIGLRADSRMIKIDKVRGDVSEAHSEEERAKREL
jgi:hypothetical protein